jgi:ABC-type Fe3+/spermidine/putrescine transport system ATPase subunit
MRGAAVPALRCQAIGVAYDGAPVLRDIDLEVGAGETVALLGPSGSGKTSLLYAVAGFLRPAAGSIEINGTTVADERLSLPPEDRDVAVVFQNYALWPHLTALETVAYPLRRQGMPRDEADRRGHELLELLGVAGLAARRPAFLSGGEQQRVGVARALARRASLVLLDEPTAHLDTALRARLLAELSDQRRQSGAAAVYATHDVTEALAVADRVALLREGRLVQVGTPTEIYERPADRWVALLSGPASILGARLVTRGERAGTVRIGEADVALELNGAPAAPGDDLVLMVRPDWASLGGELEATVASVMYRGPHTDYRLATPAGPLELREPGPPASQVGQVVRYRLRRAWIAGPAGDAVPSEPAAPSR